MKFGPVPAQQTGGSILAHSLRLQGRKLKKGHVLTADDAAALQCEGIAEVIVAQLEPGDVDENEAAQRIAAGVSGPGVKVKAAFTGRCNLFASDDGLLIIDEQRVRQANQVHESMTVATLAPFTRVGCGQMVATVKVIPFAVPLAELQKLEDLTAGGALRIAKFTTARVGLVQTRFADTKERVLDKTVKVIEGRLAGFGATLAMELRCAHTTEAIADNVGSLIGEGAGLILVVGASAIVDRRDVIPAGIQSIGGELLHFGMPVDPGNLLLLARHGETIVLGLPGCARSPAFNGLDQVLERVLAQVPVTGLDIMAMGVGGLLKENAERPLPRAGRIKRPARSRRIAAVVLASGQSRRMGATNKLLAELDGVPMIVRVVDAVIGSGCAEIHVVVGHQSERVAGVLRQHNVKLVRNPDYAEGLSASLRHGLAALPEEVDGALICLGDMPRVTSADIDAVLNAFNLDEGRGICVPTFAGKRGNPVLFARRFFAEMAAVEGDAGAKHIIGEQSAWVVEVPMEQPGVLTDIDSPQALARLRRRRS